MVFGENIIIIDVIYEIIYIVWYLLDLKDVLIDRWVEEILLIIYGKVGS